MGRRWSAMVAILAAAPRDGLAARLGAGAATAPAPSCSAKRRPIRPVRAPCQASAASPASRSAAGRLAALPGPRRAGQGLTPDLAQPTNKRRPSSAASSARPPQAHAILRRVPAPTRRATPGSQGLVNVLSPYSGRRSSSAPPESRKGRHHRDHGPDLGPAFSQGLTPKTSGASRRRSMHQPHCGKPPGRAPGKLTARHLRLLLTARFLLPRRP
jgi:hypothetical protein